MIPSHWSGKTYEKLHSLLEGPPGLAAFDFDYTLIQGDQGEALMNEIVLGGYTRADESWFWDHWPTEVHRQRDELKTAYERYRYYDDPLLLVEWMDGVIDVYESINKQLGAETAYRWSSIFFAGYDAEQIGSLSQKVFTQQLTATQTIGLPSGRELPMGIRIRPAMQDLVRTMVERHWTVYIVTASPRIPIAVLADRWHLKPEDVIGMELQIMEDGRFGPQIIEPYSCDAGKVVALRAKTDLPLRFAAGDSVMDMPMLEEAETALVLDRGSVRLRERAMEKGWLVEKMPVIA